jgi:hypothetical protein
MVLDIQTVHHILKNTAVQNVNITDLISPLTNRRLMPLYLLILNAWYLILYASRIKYHACISVDNRVISIIFQVKTYPIR